MKNKTVQIDIPLRWDKHFDFVIISACSVFKAIINPLTKFQPG